MKFLVCSEQQEVVQSEEKSLERDTSFPKAGGHGVTEPRGHWDFNPQCSSIYLLGILAPALGFSCAGSVTGGVSCLRRPGVFLGRRGPPPLHMHDT